MFHIITFWSLAFLFIKLSYSQDQLEDDLIIEINNGKVKGKSGFTSVNHVPYYSFRGIPYALPPLENLRFKPPVPALNWDGVLETSDDEKRCISSINGGYEDCLYVNVFIPKTQLKSAKLPVMVWIYGGYFIGGDSSEESYGPDFFLEENVIIVTFNYRLGIFGYLSTEDEVSPGNYGLKDQILALKWVQDNIEYFGGDSNSITVFGQSAGAASIAYLLQTPLTQGLFQRAILQSGTSLNPWALARYPRGTANAVGRMLGFNVKNSTELVDILRRVDARVLQNVQFSTQLIETVIQNPLDTVVFGPSLEPDIEGAVVTGKSYELLRTGHLNKVPLIVGFNSEESIAYKQIINDIRPLFITLLSYKLVPADMNIQNIFQRMTVGFLIKHTYFGIAGFPVSETSVTRFLTDDLFVRPIYEYVTLLSKFNPVYFYRFSYQGSLGVNGVNRTQDGVGHQEELNYLWEKSDVTTSASYADLLTRQRLVKLWTNFAKFANPTPDPNGLFDNTIWPVSYYQNIQYLDIGQDVHLSSNLNEYNVRFWQALYRIYGQPPFDTF